MTRKGWLLFIAMSVVWGIPYFFIKIAVRELDPGFVVFCRVCIASVILLPIAASRGILQQMQKRWLAVAVLACIQVIGPFLLISYGEQHISSSLTSLLIAADPLLVVLFALRFDPSERVSGLRLLGLLIGMVGVVVLLGLDVGGDEQRLLGAVFVLLAATGYAISTLLVKRPAIASLPNLGVVTIMCIISTIVLFPLAVTRLPSKIPDPGILASLLILGAVCTALAYLLFYALIAEVGAGRGAVITYVNPAVAVFLGVTVLGEPLTIAIIVGFLLIILGSWLSTGGTLPPWIKLLRTQQPQQTSHETSISSQNASHQQP